MSREYFGFDTTQAKTLQSLLAVPEGSIAANSVATASIQDGAVTGAKLGAMTSAELLAAVSNETGTGVLVFSTSPTLVTPALGTPSALVLTNATGLVNAGVDAAAAIALSKLADVAAGADGLGAGTLQATFQDLYSDLAAAVAINTAQATSITNLNAWATALATKLNADAGVTDVDYDTNPQA